MRTFLVCAALCACAPAVALASSDFVPEESPTSAVTFAFATSRHSVFLLPDSAVKAMGDNGELSLETSTIDLATSPMAAAQVKAREVSRNTLCHTAVSVAAAHDLPAPFFANLIQQESGFKPQVISPVGAQGIAQFMPRTARAYGLENPFEPIHALAVSARFLRELVGQFGNLGLAAAAYNAGPKKVIDWMARRGKLPDETQNYVRSITGRPAEQWAKLRKSEDMTLPPHARCPVGIIATREARANEPSAALIKLADAARPAIKSAARGRKASRIAVASQGKPLPNLGKPAQIMVEAQSIKIVAGRVSQAVPAAKAAPIKPASAKLASAKSTPVKLASAKSTPLKLTSANVAPLKTIAIKTAAIKTAAIKTAAIKSGSTKAVSAKAKVAAISPVKLAAVR